MTFMPVKVYVSACQGGIPFQIVTNGKCLWLLPKDLNFFLLGLFLESLHSVHFFPFLPDSLSLTESGGKSDGGVGWRAGDRQ